MRSVNKRVLIFALGMFLVMLALILFQSLDSGIISGIYGLHFPALDQVMSWVSNVGSGIVIFFIITALFLYEERKRRWIPPLWLSFALASLITLGLKLLIVRERPFEVLSLVSTREFAFWDSSFPSWHAVMAFSALPVLDREFPRIKIFWIVFALLIVFSRMYFGIHFLSDVIAGALLGYLSGFLFVRIWEGRLHGAKHPRRDGRK